MNENNHNTNVSDLSIIYSCMFFGIILVINPELLKEILAYDAINTILGIVLLFIAMLGVLSNNYECENIIFSLLNNFFFILVSFIPLLFAYLMRKYIEIGVFGFIIDIFCYCLAFLSLVIFMVSIDNIKVNLNSFKFDTKNEKIKSIATLLPGVVSFITIIFQIVKHYFK